jgi:hypothetical protein
MSYGSRATCPHCRRAVVVLGVLELRTHDRGTDEGREHCEGSRLPVDLDDIHLVGTRFQTVERGAASGC